jgi:L-seryl-tRNA(Ser) seleniumtransferase
MELRDLPSVDRLVGDLASDLPRPIVTDIARAALETARATILAGGEADPSVAAAQTAASLQRARPRGVINATGVLLHTNLGRAPIHPKAADVAAWTATGYSNVEIDLADGGRGGRTAYLEALLMTITGAEAALAVNNNAAALFLTLIALARDREVPVSRGELIEIGGSYRLPELMDASGCRLIEVGTTNRTRIGDFRAAVGGDTAMLLKVHPSNYRVAGFSEEAPLEEMVALGRESALPTVFDIGSGLIDERAPWLAGPPPKWLADEPGVLQSIEAGVDLAMFSGDKLFGGPQAGIIVGSQDLIGQLRRHPVSRAMRLDGASLNALVITAEMYAEGRAGELPFWEMATTAVEELQRRCEQIAEHLDADCDVIDAFSTIGAGSVPGSEVPSRVMAFGGPDVDRLYLAMLSGQVPVVARRDRGRLLVDLRAVHPSIDGILTRTLAEALARCRS